MTYKEEQDRRAREAALETTVKLRDVQDLACLLNVAAEAGDDPADVLGEWVDKKVAEALRVRASTHIDQPSLFPPWELEAWKK